jgi:hypothetical protein
MKATNTCLPSTPQQDRLWSLQISETWVSMGKSLCWSRIASRKRIEDARRFRQDGTRFSAPRSAVRRGLKVHCRSMAMRHLRGSPLS